MQADICETGTKAIITIACETPNQSEVHTLFEEANRYYNELYNPADNHLEGTDDFSRNGVTFLVARENGRLVGFGALVAHGAHGDWGEIKRMYVPGSARGRGVGKLILDRIVVLASEAGMHALRLETGNLQEAALGLYRAAGFAEIKPFAEYKASEASLFFEKQLS